jgi:hypothetical protein
MMSLARLASVDDAFRGLPRLVEIRRLPVEPAHAGVGAGHHRRQRLIDLMRDGGGQFSQCGHARNMGKLRAGFVRDRFR